MVVVIVHGEEGVAQLLEHVDARVGHGIVVFLLQLVSDSGELEHDEVLEVFHLL